VAETQVIDFITHFPYFGPGELGLHINVLKLKAILFGLKSLCSEMQNVSINVRSDNTTSVHCVNNMGSYRSSDCNDIVQEIRDWAISKNIWLICSHIHGVLNIEADKESRKCEQRLEWQLDPTIFGEAIEHLEFQPEMDLFASWLNNQLPLFCSSDLTQAFSFDWRSIAFYAFPPFSIIVSRMIQKIIVDRATGIVIAPNWPNQPWYSKILSLLLTKPFIIPRSIKQLILKNRPNERHPMAKSLELWHVWCLGGIQKTTPL